MNAVLRPKAPHCTCDVWALPDEFVVLIHELYASDQESRLLADNIANKILMAFEERFRVNGNSCSLGVSVGVRIFDGADSSTDDVLNEADRAMYDAKAVHRNTVRFYSQNGN